MKFRDTVSPSLIHSGAATFTRWMVEYRARRRQEIFTAKVVSALSELGLDQSDFDLRVKALLLRICIACDAQNGERANAHALAIEFFLRFAVEYPHLVEKAVKFKGVFMESISVIRLWHLVNRIDAPLAENSIERIKNFLIAQLRGMDNADDDRLLAELQIREL